MLRFRVFGIFPCWKMNTFGAYLMKIVWKSPKFHPRYRKWWCFKGWFEMWQVELSEFLTKYDWFWLKLNHFLTLVNPRYPKSSQITFSYICINFIYPFIPYERIHKVNANIRECNLITFGVSGICQGEKMVQVEPKLIIFSQKSW